MIATWCRPGMTSRRSPNLLPARSVAWRDKPVALPPGRARLATRPLPTGSLAIAKTMGMTSVACLTATPALPVVTMTSTLSRTNSAAISENRSLRPSPQRYSIATLRPSVQPSSASRRTKAAVHWRSISGEEGARSPMIGSLARCCPRAASGHANAVPPSEAMNFRLAMLIGIGPSSGGSRALDPYER